jgi:hypothetical protein
MMQRLFWEESIQAVKLSTEFTDFRAFRQELEKTLPWNSSYVRVRRARSIIRWFFPSHTLDNLVTKVWTFYKEEAILKEIMRHEYLSKEPVVAEFIVNHLLTLSPGASITANDLKDFLLKKYGVVKDDSLNNLRLACRDLGFTYRGNNSFTVCQIPEPRTSLLILVHHLFAPNPRTVTIKEILSHPFWQYLCVRGQDSVRKIFREADANGIITKYIVADQLEQITTKYSLDEFIQRRIRL